VFDIRAEFQTDKVMAGVYLAIAIADVGERRRRWPTLPKQRRVGVARQPMKVPLLIDHLDQLRSSQMRLELSTCVMSRSRCLFALDG
jgi:hypothetical protein